MIHPSGTFEYEAEFTSDSFGDNEVVLHGKSTRSFDSDCLVGHSPKLRFWNERLVIIASEETGASARNCSFQIGDAVVLAAQPGDRLYVVRTGRGGIGLSLLNDERLNLAIGAVTRVPLGRDVKVVAGPKSRQASFVPAIRDRWLEFQVGSERAESRERGLTDLAGYQIYVERCWEDGIPGVDECLSMCVANIPPLNLACLRSAVMLGHSDFKITRWDGSEILGQC